MIPLFKVLMSSDAKRRVGETLDSGYVGEGPRVKEFEAALAAVLGTNAKPLATSSCTAAIELSLRLAGVGHGSEIVTPAMNCTAGTAAILNQGSRPVWADVDPNTGNINPKDVALKITPRTKAIMAVDWAGRPCDYDALREIAQDHDIPIIEDAAHAFLATIEGATIADMGGDYLCYSFGPIKHLTCGGSGGALIMGQRPSMPTWKRAKLLRWYGIDRDNSESYRCGQNIPESGGRWHMTDVEASIGLANLSLAVEGVRKHRENAEWYHKNLPKDPLLVLPKPDSGAAWWLYTVRIIGQNRRDQFIKFLGDRGIAASPVHARNDIHKAYQYYNGPLPGTDEFASTECAIPVGWWMTQEDRERVRDTVIEWVDL